RRHAFRTRGGGGGDAGRLETRRRGFGRCFRRKRRDCSRGAVCLALTSGKRVRWWLFGVGPLGVCARPFPVEKRPSVFRADVTGALSTHAYRPRTRALRPRPRPSPRRQPHRKNGPFPNLAPHPNPSPPPLP